MNGGISSDRLIFLRKGAQAAFLSKVKEKLGLTWEELGRLIDVHSRTVRDWYREKYNMSHKAALKISEKSGIPILSKTRIKKWEDHIQTIKYLGYKATIEKYGMMPRNEFKRNDRWHQWWHAVGQHQIHSIHNDPLSFTRAPKSEQLAEFIGIMLGDGGLTKYQVKVTLHAFDDKAYGEFVRELFTKLFGVTPSVQRRTDSRAIDIVISRIALVKYCVELGLVIGNKVLQHVDIPPWVKKSERYRKACIKGLMDTDGGVINHTYTVNGKRYLYKKLSFTSLSAPLLQSVYETLTSLGIKTRIGSNHDVRIDSKLAVSRYFNIIGSSNPKHLNRYYS